MVSSTTSHLPKLLKIDVMHALSSSVTLSSKEMALIADKTNAGVFGIALITFKSLPKYFFTSKIVIPAAISTIMTSDLTLSLIVSINLG